MYRLQSMSKWSYSYFVLCRPQKDSKIKLFNDLDSKQFIPKLNSFNKKNYKWLKI